jgi:hypothetical protein
VELDPAFFRHDFFSSSLLLKMFSLNCNSSSSSMMLASRTKVENKFILFYFDTLAVRLNPTFFSFYFSKVSSPKLPKLDRLVLKFESLVFILLFFEPLLALSLDNELAKADSW